VVLLSAYISLARAWISWVTAWDPETGEFQYIEGPAGFVTWEDGRGSRFLVGKLTGK
jgi:hypothetical protein